MMANELSAEARHCRDLPVPDGARGHPHESVHRLLRRVHWHLRDGFCGSIRALGRCAPSLFELQLPLCELERMVQGCEKLLQVEREALLYLRSAPDSSWANADLLWAADALREKMRAVAQSRGRAAVEVRLEELHGYLALFVGELLVQLYSKEAALEEVGAREIGARGRQRLLDGLEEVLELLGREVAQ